MYVQKLSEVGIWHIMTQTETSTFSACGERFTEYRTESRIVPTGDDVCERCRMRNRPCFGCGHRGSSEDVTIPFTTQTEPLCRQCRILEKVS